MKLAPKLVLSTLIINGIISGIIFALPGIVAVGLWFLILPGLILGILPTLFIYHACAAVPWLIFHQRKPFLSYLLPVLIVGPVAIGMPGVFNDRLQKELSAEQARNAPPPTKLATVDSIALQSNSKAESLNCGYLCQLLLFNKVAKKVVVNPLTGQGKPLAFRLAANAECYYQKTKRLLEQDSYLDPGDLAHIAVSTHLRLSKGICILPGTPASKPNLEIHWITQRTQFVSIRGAEIIAPGQWTARLTDAHVAHIYTSLVLEPQGTGMTFSYWRLAARSQRPLETTILSYLRQLTNFDLALPPTPSPDVIRDHIDDLVKDPSAPSAAFLLVKD